MSGKSIASSHPKSEFGDVIQKDSIRLSCAVALVLMACLCGCSTFNRDWKRAVVPPESESSMEGPWEGSWKSDVNGHRGGLRCLMAHETNSVYRARFRATYGSIFHFSYTVPLEVQPHFAGWEFSGEADLGKLAGGVYYYEGRATPT